MEYNGKNIIQGDIPAPATLEFMQKVNTKMAQLEERSEQICKKLDVNLQQNTEDHRRIFDKMEKFIESSDKRYASKNVEKILWGTGATIGIILLGAILSLILK